MNYNFKLLFLNVITIIFVEAWMVMIAYMLLS